jgi:predicted phosphodiesterase
MSLNHPYSEASAMRVVLMSDIHGNLPALRAVSESLPASDEVVVAGDHCLDGPCPDGTLDLLAELGWTLVVGNTDRDIVSDRTDVSQAKRDRITWTRERLGRDRLETLGALPFSRTVQMPDSTLLVVHANPLNLHDHLRPTMSDRALAPYLEGTKARYIAFGHLHTPYVRPAVDHVLLNVASVGHPKDGDTRTGYTVIDVDGGAQTIQQVRIPYDLGETVRLLRESDMPGAGRQIEELYAASL